MRIARARDKWRDAFLLVALETQGETIIEECLKPTTYCNDTSILSVQAQRDEDCVLHVLYVCIHRLCLSLSHTLARMCSQKHLNEDASNTNRKNANVPMNYCY